MDSKFSVPAVCVYFLLSPLPSEIFLQVGQYICGSQHILQSPLEIEFLILAEILLIYFHLEALKFLVDSLRIDRNDRKYKRK